MHIFLLVETPLSKRDYDRFGVEILASAFSVSVLDFTAWIKPGYWNEFAGTRHDFAGYRVLASAAALEHELAASGPAIALDFLGDGEQATQIRRAFAKRTIPLVLVRFLGLAPQPAGLGKLRMQSRQQNLLVKVVNRIRRELAELVNPAPRWDRIAILSGDASLNHKAARAQHQIWAHSFDYDVYLQHRDGASGRAVQPYALFLDNDLPHHPDYLHSGIAPPVTPERYYPAINRFFDRFEQVTGMKIVIAAHPRSRYDLRPELFGSRQPLLGQTPQLVRDAGLVFTIQSTAISYAVLWDKPLFYLSSDEYEKSRESPLTHAYAAQLGTPLLNIDRFTDAELDLERLMRRDRDAYGRYKTTYIKRPGTPELPIWQIFADYVAKNLSNP